GGAAAFKPNEIDHFEVVTFDGKKLVQVQVQA
ncbi:RNA polymerase subunit sigma, partial [Streptomyces sp. NPDC002586]